MSHSSRMSVLTSAAIFLMMVSLVWASFPTSPVFAGITPTPTSSSDGGGGGDDDGGGGGDDDSGRPDPCESGAVWGQVADLCLGEPGRGIEVTINGDTIRTDANGRFSLTGLSPGEYDVSLNVSGDWQPESATVRVGTCGAQANVGLNYNTCLAAVITPTATATITPTAEPLPIILPETGNHSPTSGVQTTLMLMSGSLVALMVGLGVVNHRRRHTNG